MSRLAPLFALLILLASVPSVAARSLDEITPCDEARRLRDIGTVCDRPTEGTFTVYAPNLRPLGVTHGPDPVPRGLAPADVAPAPVAAANAPYRDPVCVEDLNELDLTLVVYARAHDRAYYGDSYDFHAIADALRDTVARANGLLHATAAAQGRSADMRVLCDAGEVFIAQVTLPTDAARADFSTIVHDVSSKGAWAQQPRVKYMIWYDDPGACSCGGMGIAPDDDRLVPQNLANGIGRTYGVTYGYFSPSTMLHEWGHNMGAVLPAAPQSSGDGRHCNDGRDVMCYPDGGSTSLYRGTRCATEVWDCGGDTYFNVAPPAGSYLATHWNLGSPLNRFLRFSLDAPVAAFALSDDDISPGDTVRFTDRSTGATSWSWDFGDGASSTQRHPSHRYATAGTFVVELTARNADGVASRETDQVVVTAATGTVVGVLSWQGAPLAERALTFARGEDTRTARTDADGSFGIDLPAGSWILSRDIGDDDHRLSRETTVLVRRDATTTVRPVVVADHAAATLKPPPLAGVGTLDVSVVTNGTVVGSCTYDVPDKELGCDEGLRVAHGRLALDPGAYTFVVSGPEVIASETIARLRANTLTTVALRVTPSVGLLSVKLPSHVDAVELSIAQRGAAIGTCTVGADGVACDGIDTIGRALRLPTGAYEVTTRAPEQHDHVGRVTVKPGATVALAPRLAPSHATLRLADPPSLVESYTLTLATTRGDPLAECLVPREGPVACEGEDVRVVGARAIRVPEGGLVATASADDAWKPTVKALRVRGGGTVALPVVLAPQEALLVVAPRQLDAYSVELLRDGEVLGRCDVSGGASTCEGALAPTARADTFHAPVGVFDVRVSPSGEQEHAASPAFAAGQALRAGRTLTIAPTLAPHALTVLVSGPGKAGAELTLRLGDDGLVRTAKADARGVAVFAWLPLPGDTRALVEVRSGALTAQADLTLRPGTQTARLTLA